MISLLRIFHGPSGAVVVLTGLCGPRRRGSASHRREPRASSWWGRAPRGMGGAFVAVADDASATWWNPAGLPATLIFDGVADVGALNSGPDRPIEDASSAGQDRAWQVAAALPGRGAQLHTGAPVAAGAGAYSGGPGQPTRGGTSPDRTVAPDTALRRLPRPVARRRGRRGRDGEARPGRSVRRPSAASGSIDEAFDAAADADRVDATRGDVDAGVLVRLARVRLGLSARNLAAPTFTGADGVSWTLDRRVRAGVALVADADRAGRQAWVVAADADLTRDDQVAGTWRGHRRRGRTMDCRRAAWRCAAVLKRARPARPVPRQPAGSAWPCRADSFSTWRVSPAPNGAAAGACRPM